MDLILLSLNSIFFIKGYRKGLITMLFSLFGTFLIGFLSWKLSEVVSVEFIEGGISLWVTKFLKNYLGEVTTFEELTSLISNKNVIIKFVLNLLLKNVNGYEGNDFVMLLSKDVSKLLTKIVYFLCLFVVFMLLSRILQKILNSTIKFCGFSCGNKILGGVLGAVKGLLIFGVMYLLLGMVANLTLSEWLVEFTRSGIVSNYLFDNVFNKIINLIF